MLDGYNCQVKYENKLQQRPSLATRRGTSSYGIWNLQSDISLHPHARGEGVNSRQRFKRVRTEPIKWPHVETRTYTQTLPARSNWPRKLMGKR